MNSASENDIALDDLSKDQFAEKYENLRSN